MFFVQPVQSILFGYVTHVSQDSDAFYRKSMRHHDKPSGSCWFVDVRGGSVGVSFRECCFDMFALPASLTTRGNLLFLNCVTRRGG